MPRFLYVQGVPERPVAHPYADAPKVFVGLRRFYPLDANGAPTSDEHSFEVFPVVIQDHPHLHDAVLKGELVQIAEPIIARNGDEARALFDKKIAEAKRASRKGE